MQKILVFLLLFLGESIALSATKQIGVMYTTNAMNVTQTGLNLTLSNLNVTAEAVVTNGSMTISPGGLYVFNQITNISLQPRQLVVAGPSSELGSAGFGNLGDVMTSSGSGVAPGWLPASGLNHWQDLGTTNSSLDGVAYMYTVVATNSITIGADGTQGVIDFYSTNGTHVASLSTASDGTFGVNIDGTTAMTLDGTGYLSTAGALSLSGQSDLLTIAGGVLLLNGVPVGGGGSSPFEVNGDGIIVNSAATQPLANSIAFAINPDGSGNTFWVGVNGDIESLTRLYLHDVTEDNYNIVALRQIDMRDTDDGRRFQANINGLPSFVSLSAEQGTSFAVNITTNSGGGRSVLDLITANASLRSVVKDADSGGATFDLVGTGGADAFRVAVNDGGTQATTATLSDGSGNSINFGIDAQQPEYAVNIDFYVAGVLKTEFFPSVIPGNVFFPQAYLFDTAEDWGTNAMTIFKNNGTNILSLSGRSRLQLAGGMSDLNAFVEDSSSAIAYKFDTANALTTAGAKIASFGNGGTNQYTMSTDGQFAILPLDGTVFPYDGGAIQIKGRSDYGEFSSYITDGTDRSTIVLSQYLDGANALPYLVFNTQIGSNRDLLRLDPGNGSGSSGDTPYRLDTVYSFTSGNLLEVANNGTAYFQVGYNGTLGVFDGSSYFPFYFNAGTGKLALRRPTSSSDPSLDISDIATTDGFSVYPNGYSQSQNTNGTVYAFRWDTATTHSSGNLIEWGNNTTNKAWITFDGEVHAKDFVMEASSIRTADTAGHAGIFQAHDDDDNVRRTFATLQNGNIPSLTIAPPSGGTVTLQGILKAADGTSGVTTNITAGLVTFTIKNGLIVGVSL